MYKGGASSRNTLSQSRLLDEKLSRNFSVVLILAFAGCLLSVAEVRARREE